VRTQFEALLTGRYPPRVTWVRDEAAHVTLRFIGEVSDDVARTVEEALRAPFDLPVFDVKWDQLGTFPGGRAPRVVWIGTTEGVKPLSALASRVAARLDPLIGAGETRPFKAHLTVGRIKEPGRNVNWRELLTRVRLKRTITRVDHVTLYQSRLSPKGPTYTVVCQSSLRP
jgi:2'-5' RNA ligase